MQLTESEYSYFSQLAWNENHDLLVKFTAETERVGFFTDMNTAPQIYLKCIKDYATSVIESRVRAYIETFKEFGKYPDGEDVEKFIEEAKPFVLNKKELLVEFFQNPLGPNIPESIVQADIRALGFALQSIFSEGLQPLLLYHVKGIAIQEREAKSLDNDQDAQTSQRKAWTRNEKSAVIGILIAVLLGLLTFIASITIPELRQFFGLPVP